MPSTSIFRRASVLCSFALTAVLVTGCLDSIGPEDEHDEPEIAAVTVAATPGGAADGSVTRTTQEQSGSLVLEANAANALTVTVLDASGGNEPVVVEHADEFQIRVLSATGETLATSASGYPFTLSLTPTQPGQAVAYRVQVYAVEHGHAEFEQPVIVSVVGPAATPN